jgi:WD40 repeat protein
MPTDVPMGDNERALCFSDHSDTVLLWSRSAAAVFDTNPLHLVHRVEAPKGHPGFQIGAVDPSARFAALAMSQVDVWDLQSNELILLDPMDEEARLQKQFASEPLEEGIAEGLRQHAITMWSLAFSTDGKTLVGVTLGGHVYVWDVEKRKRVRDFYITEPPPKN